MTTMMDNLSFHPMVWKIGVPDTALWTGDNPRMIDSLIPKPCVGRSSRPEGTTNHRMRVRWFSFALGKCFTHRSAHG
jgi:hypothetical protein